MKLLLPALLLVMFASAAVAADHNQLDAKQIEGGWSLLFDGETLDGWAGDPDVWSVEDGAIVGSTDSKDIESNTFLIYKRKRFSDFMLWADVRLRNHNTGIQFRSEELPGWVVKGYQADAAEGNWWGSLYGEKTGRGVIVNGWKGKGETAVRPGEWNRLSISCVGDHITITLNQLTTVSFTDPEADKMLAEGIIALQVHQGPKMRVEFRNIKVRGL